MPTWLDWTLIVQLENLSAPGRWDQSFQVILRRKDEKHSGQLVGHILGLGGFSHADGEGVEMGAQV